jgi:hypothetical protein
VGLDAPASDFISFAADGIRHQSENLATIIDLP